MRCKFRCNSIQEKTVPVGEPRQFDVSASAVVPGDYEPNHENSQFWKFTPAGYLSLNVVNEAAIAGLEAGKEFYINITPVDG